MRKSLLLLVLLVVPCLAQDYSGLTITPSDPYISIGTNLEEPSLEIEPLTKSELARLSEARRAVREAKGSLAMIESDIAIHHGALTTHYDSNDLVFRCGGVDTKVEVHGKYVFRTRYLRPSCVQFVNALPNSVSR